MRDASAAASALAAANFTLSRSASAARASSASFAIGSCRPGLLAFHWVDDRRQKLGGSSTQAVREHEVFLDKREPLRRPEISEEAEHDQESDAEMTGCEQMMRDCKGNQQGNWKP